MSMLTTVAACSHGQPWDKPCVLCLRKAGQTPALVHVDPTAERLSAIELRLAAIERILTSERDPASGEAGY